MTHTFKKVALFAAVFSVAATQTAAKDVLAKLDGFVTFDTAAGAGINVVLGLANGYVNGTVGAFKGAQGLMPKAKATFGAQFAPTFKVEKSEDVEFVVGTDAPKDHHVTAAELLAKGVEIKEGKVAGKSTDASTNFKAKVDAAKKGVKLTFSVGGKEQANVEVDADAELSIDISKMTPEEKDALLAMGAEFSKDGKKLVGKETAQVGTAKIDAAADKAVVPFKPHKYKAMTKEQFAKGSLNVLATVYLVASIANTVRHLMAKQAQQVEETEVTEEEVSEVDAQ